MIREGTLEDNCLSLVTENGNGLLDLIPNSDKLNILDLGCGNGRLTDMMAQKGNYVVGVDNNYDVINKAKRVYPHLEFKLMDALDLQSNRKWDIVFSNMVFHWIDDHDALLKKISKALKQSGVLICEFGVKGNTESIENAVKEVLNERGGNFKSRFNYTTEEEFGNYLINNGFNVDVIYTYERNIPLHHGEDGLREWVLDFYDKDIAQYSLAERVEILKSIEDLLRDKLWNGKEWVADHKRLKVIAYTL